MGKSIFMPLGVGSQSFIYPQKCVYCGKPKEKVFHQLIPHKHLAKRYKELGKWVDIYENMSFELDVPYCIEHYKISLKIKSIYVAMLIFSFVVGIALMLIVGITVGEIISPERGPQLPNWMQGLFIFGMISIFVLGFWKTKSVVARLFLPYLDGLWISNITMVFYSLGFSFAIPQQQQSVFGYFSNNEIADEFRELNGGRDL